jgi:hypothetical protein
MSLTTRNTAVELEDLKNYVEDIVVEALHNDTVSPAAMLECVYYAVEPDLLAAFRAFAALSSAERLMVMSYAKRLSDGTLAG